MSGRFAGQTALVTGATRGIGRAVAELLGSEGASLVVAGRDHAALDGLCAQLRGAGTRCLGVAGDLAKADAVLELARQAEAFGPIDSLINNAGIAVRKVLADTEPTDWDATFDINLRAPYLLTRALLPGLLSRGKGRIVNIGSISSVIGTAKLTAYCASKWGLVGFTKALAKELDGTGVSVTAILPGSTDTDMLKGSGFTAQLTPAQVARTAAFIATVAPTAMNGAVFELFD